jgi:cystinosin
MRVIVPDLAAHMSMDTDNVNAAALSEPLLDKFQESNEEESQDQDSSIPRHVTSTRSIFNIYTEQSGSCRNITQGLALLTVFGTIIGLAMPKNPALPTPWYRSLSSVIGYTYFMCWSVSYYPQIVTNFQTKSVSGLSTDASVIAVLIDICYLIYTAAFYWNHGIREEYKSRHNTNVDVESNDVAFCIHAVVLDLVTLGQILWYGGWKKTTTTNPISHMTTVVVGGVLLLCGVYASCRAMHLSGFLWIDFLYILSFVKVSLSIVTYVRFSCSIPMVNIGERKIDTFVLTLIFVLYTFGRILFQIPQILLNSKRQSTVGWNIWGVYLDFSGGVLSMMQLLADSADMGDVTGITGNWAKFWLGFTSLFFDVRFCSCVCVCVNVMTRVCSCCIVCLFCLFHAIGTFFLVLNLTFFSSFLGLVCCFQSIYFLQHFVLYSEERKEQEQESEEENVVDCLHLATTCV